MKQGSSWHVSGLSICSTAGSICDFYTIGPLDGEKTATQTWKNRNTIAVLTCQVFGRSPRVITNVICSKKHFFRRVTNVGLSFRSEQIIYLDLNEKKEIPAAALQIHHDCNSIILS